MGYVVRDTGGTDLGTLEMSISGYTGTYVMTTHMVMGNATDHVVLTMDADDLEPVSETRTISVPGGGMIPQGLYEVRSTFADNQITIDADLPDDQHQGPVTIDIPTDSYCNDQVWYLLRALPLQVGYTGRYTNVILWTNFQAPSATVKVVSEETLQTPAGSFHSYRLNVSVGDVTTHFWFGVESPHYLVKYQKGDTSLLLSELPQ